MIDLTGLPPIKFKVVGDIEEEEPVELDMETARIIMDRATRNVNELINIVAEGNPTSEQETTSVVATDDRSNEGSTGGKLSVEVSWDVEESAIPSKAQELVVLLVGSGIIMALKDSLSNKSLDERLAELARIRIEEDSGNRTTLTEAAEQFDIPLDEL